MTNIAIFASHGGAAAASICQSLNGGSRMKVRLIVSDRENSSAPELAEIYGAKGVYLSREVWTVDPAPLEALLREEEIGWLVLTDFMSPLPAAVENAYAGRISSYQEDAPLSPGEVTALMGIIRNATAEVRAEPTPEVPSGNSPGISLEKETPADPDSQWAKALGMTPPPHPIPVTPPPVPGSVPPAPYVEPSTLRSSQQAPAGQDAPEPMPPTYLIWSVLCTLLCCFVPGIVAIVFSSQVSGRYYAGDYEGARRNSRRAEIWIIVSFVLGLISNTVAIPLMFYAG